MLLLDEPFSGLDRPGAEGLEALIAAGRGGAGGRDRHPRPRAGARAATSVLCINGRQIACGEPDAVLGVAVLEATYGGAIVEIPGGGGRAILPPHHHHH